VTSLYYQYGVIACVELLIQLLHTAESLKVSLGHMARELTDIKLRIARSADSDGIDQNQLKICQTLQELEALEQSLSDNTFYRNAVR
jgi:hypothetical protein